MKKRVEITETTMQVLIPFLISSYHIIYADNVKEDCLGLLVRKTNGALECQECLSCPAGMQPDPPCHTGKEVKDGEFDKHCIQCKKGFYKETHGGISNPAACLNCNDSRCRVNYKVETDCTETHPETCSQECILEYYKNFLEQCVPCCHCLNAEDKREMQCRGYRNKQCRSLFGKCREIPKSSKSTSSTSMQPKSSRTNKGTNTPHQVVSTTEQPTRRGKLKTSVRPTNTYFPKQTRFITKAPTTSSLLTRKVTSHALSATKSTKSAKPTVSSEFIATTSIVNYTIIPTQPSKGPAQETNKIKPGAIVGLIFLCLLLLLLITYDTRECWGKLLCYSQTTRIQLPQDGGQNLPANAGSRLLSAINNNGGHHSNLSHVNEGVADSSSENTPFLLKKTQEKLPTGSGNAEEERVEIGNGKERVALPPIDPASEQATSQYQNEDGTMDGDATVELPPSNSDNGKAETPCPTTGERLETWEDIVKIKNVSCWQDCKKSMEDELSSADAQLSTVIENKLRATDNERKLCNEMYRFFCEKDDKLRINTADDLLQKLAHLRPELTVGQFVYVAKKKKLNNLVLAIHNQLHTISVASNS